MTERFNAYPKNIVSGNETLAGYYRNGAYIKGQDLEEVVILRTGKIDQGETHTINLAEVGYPLRLLSIWLDAPTGNNTGIDFEVFKENLKIYDFNLSRNQTPYEFPYLVLKPDIKIDVSPDTDVNSITIFCKQVAILEEPNI